jgi:hypothetical protein
VKSVCDCVMPEYWCAECPQRDPSPEMVLVGVTDGAPGYSVMCFHAKNSADAADSEYRLTIDGRRPRWVSMEDAKRGIDEFRAWRDAK